MKIWIGTSGWHYGHWKGSFYPEDLPAAQMLAWYAERFDTVELNNTFYRLPPEGAAENWCRTVPRDFCFAVKGSRFITHMKKLRDPEIALERFFSRIEPLGRKLGPILFQLPPRWELNLERLSAFLNALPSGHRYAFEFRDPEWHVEAAYRLLEKHNAAFCTFELEGFTAPIRQTADFAYLRLHGPGKKYQGSYNSQTLTMWARRINSWRLDAVHVYFDNDERGFAAANASELATMLDRSPEQRVSLKQAR
jgi:uncharacterized protein YecE (DUF72 family)